MELSAGLLFKLFHSPSDPVFSCPLPSASVSPLQALHNENMSLKAEVQNLQAQISDQVRCAPGIYI